MVGSGPGLSLSLVGYGVQAANVMHTCLSHCLCLRHANCSSIVQWLAQACQNLVTDTYVVLEKKLACGQEVTLLTNKVWNHGVLCAAETGILC